MKQVLFLLAFLLLPLSLFPAYQAGDLVDSIKRSQNIVDLYLERWAVVENSYSMEELDKMDYQSRFYHVFRGGFAKYTDLYLHVEGITNLPVQVTPYRQEKLDFYRIFGSAIIQLNPIIESNDFSWGLAFSMAGYRYGMKATATMNNTAGGALPAEASSSSSFKTHEYALNQTFDDLYVLTNIIKPFGYIHTGIFVNKNIDPGPDGLFYTEDDKLVNSHNRFFFNSNLFNFLSLKLGYDSEKESTDFFSTKIDFISLFVFSELIKKREIWPDIFLGYSYSKQTTDSTSLQTLFFEITYNYYNAFYIKNKTEFYLNHRTQFNKKYVFRQIAGEIGITASYASVSKDPEKYYSESSFRRAFSYYFIFGLSYYIDEKTMNYGNDDAETYGFSFGLKTTFAAWLGGLSAEVKVSRNYSQKLTQLMESYNHWIYEGSLQFSF